MTGPELTAFLYGAVGKWAMYGLAIFVVGLVSFRFVSLARVAENLKWAPATGAKYDRRLARAGIIATGILIWVHLWRLFAQTYSIFGIDESVSLANVNLVLLEMAWGTGWLLQAVGATFAFVAFVLARYAPGFGWWLTIAGGFIVAASLPFTGHAAAEATNAGLAIGSQTAHVLAAGLWLGTLSVTWVVGITKDESTDTKHEMLKGLIGAFLPVALIGVIIVTVSGLVTAISLFEHLNQLWTTTYGRWLLLKLALVGGVVALGGYNRIRVVPKLGNSEGTQAFRKITVIELGVALFVLVVTAVFTGLGIE